MQAQNFCQSCAMPITEDIFGTNADGSKNPEYCKHCYQDGKYTMECTMQEMIDFCAPYMAEADPNLTPEKAKEQMQAFFPKLKRWQTA